MLLLAVTSAYGDWPANNTNIVKWLQGPDPTINGFDVLVGQGKQVGAPPIILASDFQCKKTGPITDIHLWTSWFGFNGSTVVPPISITLGIWTDVPANGTMPSHPGTLLWTNTFNPGQYKVRPWSSSDEQFWDPDPAPIGGIYGLDNLIWQYNFYAPAANTFTQTGSLTAPVTYWLSMTASGPQTTGNGPFFGWKTSTNVLLDNAVFGHLDPAGGTPIGDWQELIDPTKPNRSLDLSFVLTTAETNPPPPQVTNKWVQYPKTIQGYDINATFPYIVADDFPCTDPGPITNVQIWASFKNDAPPDPNLRFVLEIWSDAPWTPSITGANGYSHPLRPICTNIFSPGEYSFTSAGGGQESFYDPATGEVTSETQIWLYNFNLKNLCCQQGSLQSPKTYWLSVFAVGPSGTQASFGWKTSTNHYHDDAVFGTPDAAGNITWKELFDPIQTAAKVSLEMAFVVNSGPHNPDCEPNVHCKWMQPPDTSTNGMDVLATSTNMMGDDFLCRVPGQISGITVWGSWNNDSRDTNAIFQLSLWDDVQGVPGTQTNYSHPGKQLCVTTFYPPQTPGTWIDRYQYSLYAANLAEAFYNPDLGSAGFIGNDTQIWRYDFYPNQFAASCWKQYGSPFNGGLTYWVVLSYIPPAGAANPYQFGWKTSITHNKDDAVYGHMNVNNLPLQDWKDLHDPRTGTPGISKDLSFALWNYPIASVNKDLFNTTATAVNGIRVVIPGFHIITAHYDGSPPWPTFQVTQSGGDTVLQWSGQTVNPGGFTHVGWEYPGPKVAASSINWMIGNVVILPPIVQANFVGLSSATMLAVVNDIALKPIMVLSNSMVEFHSDALTLDQMNPNPTVPRNPISMAMLTTPMDPILPGGAMLIPLPQAPAGARYAMLKINLSDPDPTPSTTDFVLLPLDGELQPLIDSVGVAGSSVSLTFSSTPERTYHVQYKTDLSASGWADTGLGDIFADTSETTVMVPLTGSQSFYRVALMPQ